MKPALFLITIYILIFTGCAVGGSGNNPPQPQNPKAPESINAVVIEETIKVTWHEVEGVENYKVSKKEEGGNWSSVSGLLNTNTYIDTNIVYDTNIYYGVQSVNNELESGITSMEVVNVPSETVENLMVRSLQSTTGIELVWSKIKDNVTYYIYRSENKNSQGVKIATTTSVSYFDNSCSQDIVYYYRILWSDTPESTLMGISVEPRSGYYSNFVDTREPENDNKDDIASDNIAVSQTIRSILHKLDYVQDVDYYRITLQPNKEYTVRLDFVNSDNFGVIQINDGNIISLNNGFKEISIENTDPVNSKIFYIKISPNLPCNNFTEEYDITVSNSI